MATNHPSEPAAMPGALYLFAVRTPSGTEPKVRVMIEGKCGEEVQHLCAGLAAEVERILS